MLDARRVQPHPRAGVLVRLRALFDSRVKVPDLADTVGPVSERNCIGAIPPGWRASGGERPGRNAVAVEPPQRELDSVGGFGEPSSKRAKPEQNSAAGVEGVERVR